LKFCDPIDVHGPTIPPHAWPFPHRVARVYDDPGADDGERALAELRDVVRTGPVTLVTAARDLDGSHVAVLARLLS
jgi:uncharacterized protein YeaO (DUF488 family)